MSSQVTIFINGNAYEVDNGNNLLAGVLANQLNLPYFCWHPSLGSVGACRQCAVTLYQDENDTRGRIAMACTTPVTEGMRVAIDDKSSSEFREQVIAAMMTNHPHDCPVCAEGGECHLQDMTVMTGHTQRNYSGKKRTFTNQYLGELVGHEMNRCITCYRCVRFYRDYAGGKDFGCYSSKNQVYFGRQQDGALESEFSGNLVEICPTGVFTNKPFSAHYARKWDLKSAPSICGFCSVGCNTTLGERYGSVRRVLNRFNDALNGYFLCDRGRYGLQFVNNKTRLSTIKINKKFYQRPVSSLTIAKAFSHLRNKKWLGVGSGRACIESNCLLRTIVGREHFNSGWSREHLAMAQVHKRWMREATIPTLKQVEQADWVFVVGEDIQQSHPRVALSVRQALRQKEVELAEQLNVPPWQDGAVKVIGQQRKLPLFSLQYSPTKLDDDSTAHLICTPEKLRHLLTYFASVLPSATDGGKYVPDKTLSDEENTYLSLLLNSFLQAEHPLFISGWGSKNATILEAFVKVMQAASERVQVHSNACVVSQMLLAPNANDVGLLHLVEPQSQTLAEQLESSEYGGVIILENELNMLSQEALQNLAQNDCTVIVLDHSRSSISDTADIILPVTPVSEYDGHFANYRAELQRFYQAVSPQNNIQPSWYWLSVLAEYCGNQPFNHIPVTLKELHAMAPDAILDWPFEQGIDDLTNVVPQETHRVSGRTAKQANMNVHEPQTASGVNLFHPSMEGKRINSAGALPFLWAPGWNANQSSLMFERTTNEVCERLSFDDTQAIVTNLSDRQVNMQETESTALEPVLPAVFNMAQWQRMEWQSAQTIDLAIRPNRFVLYVPSDDFLPDWRHGEWRKLTVLVVDGNVEISVPVQVVVEPRLTKGHYCAQIESLVPATWYRFIDINDLSENELAEFEASLTDQLAILKTQQQEVLAKLKNDDQFIPIRMMHGGDRDS